MNSIGAARELPIRVSLDLGPLGIRDLYLRGWLNPVGGRSVGAADGLLMTKSRRALFDLLGGVEILDALKNFSNRRLAFARELVVFNSPACYAADTHNGCVRPAGGTKTS